ncbi:GntR family transcriptional regulator [Acidiferrimicrobium sp. IK]|nr:GntR family transcriptional regulator [Acidiferrimicrobium sp. IK]
MTADTRDPGAAGVYRHRQQLSTEVANHVRQQILSGHLRPGAFIRQEKIAEDLGLSATPVREGLLALRGEGFVLLRPRRGFVVAPLDASDIRDLFTAQALIAGEMAACAARRLDGTRIEELETLHPRAGCRGRRRRGPRRRLARPAWGVHVVAGGPPSSVASVVVPGGHATRGRGAVRSRRGAPRRRRRGVHAHPHPGGRSRRVRAAHRRRLPGRLGHRRRLGRA